MKIQICGFSGSGKSTFAKRLASFYDIDVLHIDTVKFSANWVEHSHQEVEADIINFMTSHQQWIIDGNYFNEGIVRFEDAEIIFLFKFNRFKCLYGALRRYWKYKGKKRDCLGVDERMNWSFIKWIIFEGRINPHKQRIKNIEDKFKNKIVVFKNRRQVNNYLKQIGIKGPYKYL